jgi:uncharacterized membrane protein YvbJ
MLDGIPCPYCGEKNAVGSNICGRCMRNIRSVTNPERPDFEETAKTRMKAQDRGLLGRIRAWWRKRQRNAK